MPAESRTAQLGLGKAAEQKSDDAPANAPASAPVDPTDAGAVGRRRERSPADALAATKGEDKRAALKSGLPAIQSADRPVLRSESASSAKGADASGQAAPGRMQAIFVFRLAPAPVAAAAPRRPPNRR